MEVLLAVTAILGLFSIGAAQNEQNETSGLRCYACAGTGGNNMCEDFNTYKEAMDGTGYPYVKKDWNTVSHIRDCGDGEYYSFSSNLQANRSAYRRLELLIANNETACVWDGQNQVCLSKCDTNFCNGPQLTEVVGGAVLQYISPCLFIFLLFANILHRLC